MNWNLEKFLPTAGACQTFFKVNSFIHLFLSFRVILQIGFVIGFIIREICNESFIRGSKIFRKSKFLVK